MDCVGRVLEVCGGGQLAAEMFEGRNSICHHYLFSPLKVVNKKSHLSGSFL